LAAKATATVNLSNLTQTYTGSALAPTATTVPAGLTIVWTGTPQTNAGTYPVTATVNDANYQGSASGTFTINFGINGLLSPYWSNKSYKIKSTFPIKWQYTNAAGTPVPTGGLNARVSLTRVADAAPAEDAVLLDDAGASGYQYDSLTNTWQFNWKTNGYLAGTYYIYVQAGPGGQWNGPFPVTLTK
jgi:hypothetical protein